MFYEWIKSLLAFKERNKQQVARFRVLTALLIEIQSSRDVNAVVDWQLFTSRHGLTFQKT
jgi:hypothetical protein